jgi:hypothetical protein
VRTHPSVIVGALLSVVATLPAHAETELSGKWVGPFKGVQIEIPVQAGPFGYESADAKTIQGPRYVENTLQISFEAQQQKGLAVGTWNAGQFKQRFVCAQIGQTMWNCVDAAGRASIEVTSATEIKVCYLDNRQGAQGAGCALLRKSG